MAGQRAAVGTGFNGEVTNARSSGLKSRDNGLSGRSLPALVVVLQGSSITNYIRESGAVHPSPMNAFASPFASNREFRSI